MRRPEQGWKRRVEGCGRYVSYDLDKVFGEAEVGVTTTLAMLEKTYDVDVMSVEETFEDYLGEVRAKAAAMEAGQMVGGESGASRAAAEKEARDAKRLAIGVKKFNKKPKDGLGYLVEVGLVVHETAKVAAFLRTTEGLYKTKIGEVLGGGDEFHLGVLEAFVGSFDFTGLDIDSALRLFLAAFRLPGEAQKIDRMMEAFAGRYHEQNPEVFSSGDTVYVLCFALIMLNTDAHNPGVKHKMTLQQFFSTTRGIDNGNDIDHALLESLYSSIVNNEIDLEPDCEPSVFDNPDKAGYLRKQGGRVKSWKKRWFLLSNSCLYYFKKPSDAAPKGFVPLENLHVVITGEKRWELRHPDGAFKAAKFSGSTLVESNHDKLLCEAKSPAERDEWIAAIQSHIIRDPYFELLQARRRALASEINALGGGKKGAAKVMERRRAASELQNDEFAAMVDEVRAEEEAEKAGTPSVPDRKSQPGKAKGKAKKDKKAKKAKKGKEKEKEKGKGKGK